MLSSRSQYALRALVCLAETAPRAQTTDQIAATTGLPTASLAKILQALNRAGIVKTQRGLGGGVELARAADQLTAREVVRVVDRADAGLTDELSSTFCPRLQRRLRVVNALADLVLSETTVDELVPATGGDNDLSPIDKLLVRLDEQFVLVTRKSQF